ncbi:MAG TPA: class I SAM-dependent methyltransferase family protein [Phycisphaerae bacterium]|nr:class I SAM-dependent methyltransferase family protein [Phycisphaerae bacterium]
MQATEWDNWHKLYETWDDLQVRLRMVREQIAAAVDECPLGSIKIISICAGDGRDVLETLSGHPRRGDVRAYLLDNHAPSLERGREGAQRADLSEHMHFINADASVTASYVGFVPADVIVISGMLGHIDLRDVPRLIGQLPMLVKKGGSVIWNRHTKAANGVRQVPAIRKMFAGVEFEEIFFGPASPEGFATGRCRFCGNQKPLESGRRLFNFVGLDNASSPTTFLQRLRGLLERKNK